MYQICKGLGLQTQTPLLTKSNIEEGQTFPGRSEEKLEDRQQEMGEETRCDEPNYHGRSNLFALFVIIFFLFLLGRDEGNNRIRMTRFRSNSKLELNPVTLMCFAKESTLKTFAIEI